MSFALHSILNSKPIEIHPAREKIHCAIFFSETVRSRAAHVSKRLIAPFVSLSRLAACLRARLWYPTEHPQERIVQLFSPRKPQFLGAATPKRIADKALFG
jgi:hypothetical protein